jgi:hypothetical protein
MPGYPKLSEAPRSTEQDHGPLCYSIDDHILLSDRPVTRPHRRSELFVLCKSSLCLANQYVLDGVLNICKRHAVERSIRVSAGRNDPQQQQ